MTTTDPKRYAKLLTVFQETLSNGLIGKHEVVYWADTLIKKDTQPHPFIIELSHAGEKSVDEIVALINHFIKGAELGYIRRPVISFIFRKFATNIIASGDALGILWDSTHKNDLSKEEIDFIKELDHEFNRIDSLAIDIERNDTRLLQFLEIYKDYSIENFDEWETIDATIEGKFNEFIAEVRLEQAEEVKRRIPKSQKKWWKFWGAQP